MGAILYLRDVVHPLRSSAIHRCCIVSNSVKYRGPLFEYCFLLLLVAVIGLFAGCGRGKNGVNEVAYVSAPQAFLRDQVAAVYNKTGTVKNGEAVQILGRDRRFARVRTSTGVVRMAGATFSGEQGNLRRFPEIGGTGSQRSGPGHRDRAQPDQHSPAAGA
jgi:hypothetical protein